MTLGNQMDVVFDGMALESVIVVDLPRSIAIPVHYFGGR